MKRLFWAAGFLGLWLGARPAAAQLTNRYVVKDNPGAAAPYDSWTVAAPDIQTAIDYVYTTTGETIWVRAATYDTGGRKHTGRYTTNRVTLSKPVVLRSENNDPANTIIKGAWDPVSTCGWLAVRGVYMVAGASLIGFTVTNGSTISSNEVDRNIISQDACGGGICAWGTTAATISNCIVTGNAAWGDRSQSAKYGGGVCDGSYFNCTIVGNSLPGGHGGGAESAVLSNCLLAANTSGGTGGGSHRGRLYSCVVSNNRAIQAGGVGGWSTADPGRAFDCLIVNNSSTQHGGGAGGGSSVGTAVLSNCVVAWNSAGGVGGGADLSILYGCRVFSNFSGNAGGTARSYLTNCVVAFNNYGGARFNVFVANTLFYGNRGWAAYVRTGDRVENCTFAGNDTGLQTDNNSTVAVVNVISYSNANNWVQNDTSVFRFTNSCTTPATLVWDASNTTNPPRFVAYGTGLNTNHIPGNYRLAPDSPCINAGLILPGMAAATDLDDRPRIDRLFQRVDMGAYEFMGEGALLRVK